MRAHSSTLRDTTMTVDATGTELTLTATICQSLGELNAAFIRSSGVVDSAIQKAGNRDPVTADSVEGGSTSRLFYSDLVTQGHYRRLYSAAEHK